jgi:beta-glucosidase
LIKNTNKTIPLTTATLEYIVLVGEKIININSLAKYSLFLNYDNIGMQCGGWSLRWQGFEGNSQWKDENKKLSNASSILDALHNLKQKVTILISLVLSN